MNEISEKITLSELVDLIREMLYEYSVVHYDGPNLIVIGHNLLMKFMSHEVRGIGALTLFNDGSFLIYGIPAMEDKSHPNILKVGFMIDTLPTYK